MRRMDDRVRGREERNENTIDLNFKIKRNNA